ncbi:MAG: hypothetical protein ACAI43_25770 [Phycisphaerae bacterium]
MTRRRRIAILTLAALSAAAPLFAGTTPPKPAVAKPAAPDPKAVETLLKQGQDALFAQDYKAATGAFMDALSLDPRSLRAVHGLALVHMYSGDFPRAGAYMERALAMAGSKPDRALVLNNAMLQIALNNPMRALKFLKEYVDAHPKDVDEPLLNALGSSLFLADDTARRARLWNDAADAYVRYQKVIEAAPQHKGKKLWGVEWLPAAEADKRMAAMKKAQQEAGKVGAETDKAEDRVLTARRRFGQVRAAYQRGNATQVEMNVANNVLTDALAEFQKLAKDYDAAVEKIIRPTFPRVLTPVAIDDVTPPAAGVTGLAMAQEDPAYKAALAKAIESPTPTGPKRAGTEPDDKPKPAVVPPPAPAPVAVIAIKTDKVAKVRVTQYAAAFAVSEDHAVTAAAPLDGAIEFELQTLEGASLKATVVRTDAKSGLALLKITQPAGSKRKLNFLPLADAAPSAGSALACVCFPTVNLFNPAAEALVGTAPSAPKDATWTIKLQRHPRLAASPLVAAGKVVGAVMAPRDALPESLPAVSVDAIRDLVGADAGPATSPYLARDPASALLQLVATREVANR